MDFKGVAWAGNIYQKFEAMCLEVEEVMYQDTVKYVENQAQKVGASVKKFYSDVMQDLLPSYCVDPMKVSLGDLSLNPYAHTDLSKKPKSFLLDNPRELMKIKTEDEAIYATILPPLCSGVLVRKTSSDLCSSTSKRLGVHRRAIAIKRISQLDQPSELASPATSVLGLGSSECASCGGSGSHVKASGDVNLKSSSNSVERGALEPLNESTPDSDAKIESSVTDKLRSAGFARQEKDESKWSSSLGTSVNGTLISQTGLSNTSNACNIESLGEKVTTCGEDTIIRDSFFESSPDIISSNTCNVEFSVEEVVLSNEDNFDMEVIQDEEVAEPRIQPIETFGGSNLEETCVFVEGDDNLDVVSLVNIKQKSYKKKIRDALSSKLRPTRKEGYTDFGGKNNPEETIPALPMESDREPRITDHESLESEWELL